MDVLGLGPRAGGAVVGATRRGNCGGGGGSGHGGRGGGSGEGRGGREGNGGEGVVVRGRGVREGKEFGRAAAALLQYGRL